VAISPANFLAKWVDEAMNKMLAKQVQFS